MSTYQEQFWHSPAVKFVTDRGLNYAAVNGFRLGYVEEPLEGDERYRGCLVLPYLDGLGRQRQVRYRPLYANPPAKYLTAWKDHPHIFGVRYTDHPIVHIAEGEIDAMSLWQVGFKAIGLPGATSWQKQWRYLFRNAEEVVIVMDPDDEGRKAAAKIYRSLVDVTTPRVVELPDGKDVNDVLLQDGEAALRELAA